MKNGVHTLGESFVDVYTHFAGNHFTKPSLLCSSSKQQLLARRTTSRRQACSAGRYRDGVAGLWQMMESTTVGRRGDLVTFPGR
jgi:hypothetical protein